MCLMLLNEMDSRPEVAGLGSWTDVMHTFDGCNMVYDRLNNTILFQGDRGIVRFGFHAKGSTFT